MDFVTSEQRSEMMSSVRSRNTKPELIVRRFLHRLGYRFRIHRTDLPGRPDIVLPRFRTVVFVHGCFWHGHTCRRARRPTSNVEFWTTKLDRNIARDQQNRRALRKAGWIVITVWECQTVETESLRHALRALLKMEIT